MMDEKQAISCEKREEKTIATVFANFASSTSAHGLVHAVNARSTITKLFWFAVLLAALSMFFFMLGLLIRDFNRKPVSTTIRIQQEKELKFPAVMVCNHNMLRKSALSNATRNAMWDHTEDKSIMSTYAATAQEGTQGNAGGTQGNAGGTQGTAGGTQGTAGDTQATINATADVDTDYVTKMNMLENLDNMDRKELEKTGHSFSNFVTYCNWKGMLCHKGLFKKYWSHHWSYMYGNCYVFNQGKSWNGSKLNPLFVGNVGTDNALTLDLNIEQDEYLESSNIESGVRVLLSDQQIFPLPVEEGFSVAPGVCASIAVKRYEIRRDDPFKNGTCKKERIGEENLAYTVQRCSQLCRLKKQAAKCNCTGLKYCSPHRTCFNATEKICANEVEKLYINGSLQCDKECPQPCRETKYKYVTTASQIFVAGFQKSMATRMSQKYTSTYIKDNFVRLKVFYEDQNVEYVDTKAYYGIAKLMSDIGGQLGLWIGVSVVTCFELIGFLFNISMYLLTRRPAQIKHSDFSEEASIQMRESPKGNN